VSKRRWWQKDEQFKAVAERLRKNYDHRLAVERKKMQDELAEQKRLMETRQKDRDLARARELNLLEERFAGLAKDVARVRLEFGPTQFGSRFTLYATFDENFIYHSHDLKSFAPVVLEMLTAKIRREFSTIDFGRAKRVMPDGPTPERYPRFRLGD